jgi:transposase
LILPSKPFGFFDTIGAIGREALLSSTPRVHSITQLQRCTKEVASRDYTLLQTVPGIGEYLGLTILSEVGNIDRFPTVKDFLSYCRLVKGTVASAGKLKGLRGAKLGNKANP